MDIADFIEKIAHVLIVAIPTAFLSTHLALRKYRTEKWWDRKLQCYCNTIDALNEIIVVCDAFIDKKVHGTTLRKAEIDTLTEKYRNNKAICFMQINIGTLLMSEDANRILSGYEYELFALENDSDQAVINEAIREITEGHLNALIPIAKSDLGVNPLFGGILK